MLVSIKASQRSRAGDRFPDSPGHVVRGIGIMPIHVNKLE